MGPGPGAGLRCLASVGEKHLVLQRVDALRQGRGNTRGSSPFSKEKGRGTRGRICVRGGYWEEREAVVLGRCKVNKQIKK